MLFALQPITKGNRFIVIDMLTVRRVETKELCVDDICVTRDQFAEVFGNQSAAAGASHLGEAETPGGSSAATAEVDADTLTTTTSEEPLSASNDNEPLAETVEPTYGPAAAEPDADPHVELAPANEKHSGGRSPGHRYRIAARWVTPRYRQAAS